MNEWMKKAREAALAILQPTRRDLERGLALHADSTVCDAYGFSPTTSPAGAAVARALNEGATPAELQDMSEEGMMTTWLREPLAEAEYRDAWETAGVTCIFQNAGEEGQSVKRLVKRLARFTFVTDERREFVSRATKADDIMSAKREGRHCLLFSANGVPLAEEWVNVQHELGYVRIFRQLGVRMMHLTYNRRNMLGDGCAEPADAGLSDFGRAAIAEMNRVGVIVDVAHSGQRTSLEAARASSRPVVASHTACMALNRHVRNKGDDVMRAIADSGGFVGICTLPAFLGGNGTISAFLDHICYAVRLLGADHVAIGTDAGHPIRNWKEEDANAVMKVNRPRWENFWPPGDPVLAPEWNRPELSMTMAWTNWPLYTVGLVQRGLSDDDIRKITGGNVMRVLRETDRPPRIPAAQ